MIFTNNKEKHTMSNNGCTDVPAVNDEFEIGKYINGLTAFIEQLEVIKTVQCMVYISISQGLNYMGK